MARAILKCSAAWIFRWARSKSSWFLRNASTISMALKLDVDDDEMVPVTDLSVSVSQSDDDAEELVTAVPLTGRPSWGSRRLVEAGRAVPTVCSGYWDIERAASRDIELHFLEAFAAFFEEDTFLLLPLRHDMSLHRFGLSRRNWAW